MCSNFSPRWLDTLSLHHINGPVHLWWITDNCATCYTLNNSCMRLKTCAINLIFIVVHLNGNDNCMHSVWPQHIGKLFIVLIEMDHDKSSCVISKWLHSHATINNRFLNVIRVIRDAKQKNNHIQMIYNEMRLIFPMPIIYY